MPALERSTFKIGGVTFPLTSSTSNSLLQDGDPTLYYLIAFCASVMQTHLGGRWSAECTRAGRTDIASAIVQYSVPLDPEPYLIEEQFKFPLLAAYRVAERSSDHTIMWHRSDGNAQIVWAMPPLMASQAEILMPFLKLVYNVLTDRISEGSDSGYSSGAQVWTSAGLAEIEVMGASFGLYDGTNGQKFPAVKIDLMIVEQKSTPASAFDALTAVGTAIDLTDADGEETDFVQTENEDLDA